MTFEFSFEMIGVILTLLTHASVSIWWASKITTTLQSLANETIRLNRELEKRDSTLASMWKRIDEVRDMIQK